MLCGVSESYRKKFRASHLAARASAVKHNVATDQKMVEQAVIKVLLASLKLGHDVHQTVFSSTHYNLLALIVRVERGFVQWVQTMCSVPQVFILRNVSLENSNRN
jgi:hypothetical protein